MAEKEQRLAAQTERDKAQTAQKVAESAQQAEKQARLRADAEKAEAGRLFYVANMNLAQQYWEQNNIGRLRQLLAETQTSPDRGFEWYYWQRQLHLALSTLYGHSDGIGSVAFSPDGQRIVTGSGDQTAKVWEAASGRELLTLKGHSNGIDSVAFSPEGQRIVTGSGDQTAKVWERASAAQVAAWQQEEQAAAQAAAQSVAASQREWTAEQERQRIAQRIARASARASDEGAIKRWLILAPIRLATGQSGTEGLDAEQVEGEGRLRPKAGEGTVIGRGEMKWQEVAQEDYVIDFNLMLGHVTTLSVGYAVCYLRSEAEQRGLQMLVGSDDEAKVYLNGKLVHKSPLPRSFIADQDKVQGIALDAGLNVLVFKVVNERLDWMGSIRFADAQGNPVKGIKVTLTP